MPSPAPRQQDASGSQTDLGKVEQVTKSANEAQSVLTNPRRSTLNHYRLPEVHEMAAGCVTGRAYVGVAVARAGAWYAACCTGA